MNTLEPDPEETQLQSANLAFRRSEAYTFRGAALEPYSFLRQTAAEALGLAYSSLSPEQLKPIKNPNKSLLSGPELTPEDRKKIEAQPAEFFIYAAMTMDAAIVLWLCSQPDGVCKKARLDPASYADAIDQWADANGLAETREGRPAALALFNRIMSDVAESKGEPDLKPEKGAAKDSPGNA